MTAVILAAGKSRRMNSGFSKVLHKIYGKPMLEYVIDSVTQCGIKEIIIVTNAEEDDIRKQNFLGKNIKIAKQKQLLGTAHALRQTERLLGAKNGHLLVLCGDVPLLTKDTLARLISEHLSRNSVATLLTAHIDDPTGYGRIIRNGSCVANIIEEIDANETEKTILEINSGIYCFNARAIFPVLRTIGKRTNTSEYYLTDVVKKFNDRGQNVFAVTAATGSEIRGVNTRAELARAQAIVKDRIQDTLLERGVAIMNRTTTDIYNDVDIDQDTIIYPFTVIESDVRIGKKCRIGPFARIRGRTKIGDNCDIGNFVELKEADIGQMVKINHHAFLADIVVKQKVTVAAGAMTITNGPVKSSKSKKTFIGQGAYIGVGALIKPGTNIPAGSVVCARQNNDAIGITKKKRAKKKAKRGK